MAVLLRPRRWTEKPPQGVCIDWGHPLANGLAGLWLLNEYGGVTHRNLAHPFVASATATSWAPRGVSFNGSTSTINVPQYAPISATPSPPNMSIWAICTSNLVNAAFHEVIRNRNAGAFLTQNSNNSWAVAFAVSGSEYNDTSTPVTAGERVSLVGTRESTNTRLFKNGVLTENVSVAASGNTSSAWDIGSDQGALDFFSGVIEVVGVWTRTLRQDEAQWLSAEPYAFLYSPPRYWVSVVGATPSTAAEICTRSVRNLTAIGQVTDLTPQGDVRDLTVRREVVVC